MGEHMEEQPKMYGVITISTTINRHLWEKAKEKHITWSEALRVGVTTILSQQGDEEFINPMQQQRKIIALVNKIEELVEENEKLRGVKQ